MSPHAPQFRLRSLTGLFLISGFSLAVWLAVAYGIAQFQHSGNAACADHGCYGAQAPCKACDR